MKISIKKTDLRENITAFMRKCGYVPFHKSYIRQLGSAFYPRFHIYIDQQQENYILNLHLDQKKPTYGNTTAHSGEYEDDGPVREEAGRIEEFLYK